MVFKKRYIIPLALLSPPLVRAQSESLPNIVLINIDDLGWSDLSGNGSEYYQSPNIDKLKDMGVWFSQGYAAASNSAPSRSSMLTGLFPTAHGVYTVNPADRGKAKDRKLISSPNRKHIPDEMPTLPSVLKDHGYTTYHVGKWHISDDPKKHGVMFSVGANKGLGHTKSFFSPYRNIDLSDGKKGEYLIDRLGDEAVNYLKSIEKDSPFFLYYAPYAVHTPIQAPQEIVDKYKNIQGTEAHFNPTYAAMIEVMDNNVGKILSELTQMGVMDNTLIIFTSDNGGYYPVSRQHPLRAGKGSFYEGGIRVPLIIYKKGEWEKRNIDKALVSHLDIFPTITQMLGIDNHNIDFAGRSLTGLLDGSDRSLERRDLFWFFPAYLEGGHTECYDSIFRARPQSVIRQGDWKLIEHHENGELELFNIAKDISESTNLRDSHPRKVKQLHKALKLWQQENKAPVPHELNPKYIAP